MENLAFKEKMGMLSKKTTFKKGRRNPSRFDFDRIAYEVDDMDIEKKATSD